MRFETLDEWLDWQEKLHPREIELGLARISAVWRRLKPNGLECPVITVGGTNGKGSCVAMLASVYRQAGYRVGVYTSPHLIRYNERITLDGEAVDDRRLCEVFDAIDIVRGDTTLTYFEFGTLAALCIFADAQPDLVILEVGLGGRLDAVNIIDADLALITTIDLDHTDWLGETRAEIGKEKAGIMRPDRPAVLADPDMPSSVFTVAEQVGARVYAQGRDFTYSEKTSGWQWSGPGSVSIDLPFPALTGQGQMHNASAVVMACYCLRQRLAYPDSALAAGLAEVKLAGRQQYFPGNPSVLLDVAHNPQAIESLRTSLIHLPEAGSVRAVFGLLLGKDVTAIASLMGDVVTEWHLMDLSGSRGRTSKALAEALKEAGVTAPIKTHATVADAMDDARKSAGDEDLVLVFGSFIVVGEAMQYLSNQ